MKILVSCVILTLLINQTWIAQTLSYSKAASVDGWQLIGTTQAKLTTDNAGIAVHSPNDCFSSIKIKVTKASLRLIKMVITYNEGAPDNIELLYDIPNGSESREIDLRSIGDRKIRRIDFWYDTNGVTTGKANVAAYGLK